MDAAATSAGTHTSRAGNLTWVGVTLLLLGGCTRQGNPPQPATSSAMDSTRAQWDLAALIDRTWEVADSGAVERGTRYTLASDGTLTIESPHGPPMRGTWSLADGALTFVEEGRSYPVDVVSLSADAFLLRSHNPGQPADLRLVPAKVEAEPPAPTQEHRPRTATVPTPPEPPALATPEPAANAQPAASLWGTSWRLESVAGVDALDGVEATLEFREPGHVVGMGSCNHFAGTAEIVGQTIHFGPIGATKRGCEGPIMAQESRYLRALEDADRISSDGSVLTLHVKGMDAPLRYRRQAP